ncbi:MAG: transposase family protein [Dehalococcoidia bacterium]
MRDVPILPGEYSNWKDTGCELHPLCLECPFPRCLEEKPRGKQQTRLKMRAYAMRKMRLSGVSVRTVARAFGVSVRTVQREMKRRRRLLKMIRLRSQ